MPAHSGYTPYPKRFGGGKPRAQSITESLTAARGTAYSTDTSSVVWVENLAAARAISAAWGTNQRLANQWDPTRMTSCLSRWEAILALPPAPTDTAPARRRRIAEHFTHFGAPSLYATLFTELTTLLGSVLVAIEFVSPANAVVHVPDGSYPWGTVVDGSPWYSTVAHILIRTTIPSGMLDSQYLAIIQGVDGLMDSTVPAWVTWDWYKGGSAAYAVSGGPSAAGFFLDDTHNLDFEVFGT